MINSLFCEAWNKKRDVKTGSNNVEFIHVFEKIVDICSLNLVTIKNEIE